MSRILLVEDDEALARGLQHWHRLFLLLCLRRRWNEGKQTKRDGENGVESAAHSVREL